MRGYRVAGLLCAIVLLSAAVGTEGSLGSGTAWKLKRSDAYMANPLGDWQLFRAANTPAAADAAGFRAHGLRHDAELMERIASQPIATWLTDDATHVLRAVTALTTDAGRRGAAPVIVAYGIPGRNCNEDVAASEGEYMRWIAELAGGIGPRRAIVILEPDAIPFAIAGCPIHIRLLRRAVEMLARAAGARVYIDAGNPSWVTPASLLVAPLREADIAQAAGFSLNVANFQTNAANIAYGHELSRLLGGAHFVIDTSRNGNGPETEPAQAPVVCNPPGRALGTPPTTNTNVPGLDAYLWVKPPGSSDGSCRPGAPASGDWWPQYALELAANAPPLTPR